jgi:hypothetical protein
MHGYLQSDTIGGDQNQNVLVTHVVQSAQDVVLWVFRGKSTATFSPCGQVGRPQVMGGNVVGDGKPLEHLIKWSNPKNVQVHHLNLLFLLILPHTSHLIPTS